MALGDDDKSLFGHSLNWPITMEAAVKGSLSAWQSIVSFGKFISTAVYWATTGARNIARIPFTNVDFPLNDIDKYSHTEAFYGSLNKEETRKLLEKCHHEGVTMTSIISSAILCVASTLVSDQAAQLTYAIAADTRRRCIPPVPNYDLSNQVSGVLSFTMPASGVPITPQGMWQLAKKFGHYMNMSIEARQILAIGMVMGKLYQKSIGSLYLTHLPTCGISNWGLLPFRERYGKWELTAMTPFGNMIRLAMPVALVQTVNGVLTIGHFGSAPLISPSTLEKLRDGTMHNLRRTIQD
jgi:hypothetical protein